MSTEFAIHWFRRDLRVAGNTALQSLLRRFDGRVVCLFSFDKVFLDREDFSHNRFAFFVETLAFLKRELESLGGSLLVLDEGPDAAFELMIRHFGENKHTKNAQLKCVSFNRDYEPFARMRDQRIKTLLENAGIAVETFRDHLILEPHEVCKPDGKPYQVFTPFLKKWLTVLHSQFPERISSNSTGLKFLGGTLSEKKKSFPFQLKWDSLLPSDFSKTCALQSFLDESHRRCGVPLPKAGTAAACNTIEEFRKKIKNYGMARDVPSLAGTSHLSIYLKNGSITTSQVVAALQLLDKQDEENHKKFLSELIWREFYYSILFHFPQVETEAFQKKFKNISWENDKRLFAAWCEGKTGFPIVDAGMRQLNQTGWMHNRVRMIVASFLTKDLLVDWRWGERYFMNKLLDGDLAPNNGGWQWAASTGCDPQPYFRIFNPELQSKKFDPEGLYIKRFVPELAHLDARHIHAPNEKVRPSNYPRPVVNHAAQKSKALRLFKMAAS